MNHAEFHDMLQDSFAQIARILDAKSDEYSSEQNKLHNFLKASHLTDETVNQAIGGMLVKHIVSIFDMISDEGDYTLERWDEKIFDSINYLLLLRASVIDESLTIATTVALEKPEQTKTTRSNKTA